MGNPKKKPTTEQDKACANGHYAEERNYPAVDIAHYRNWIPIYLMRSRRELLIWGTVGVLSATGILSHVGITGIARWLLALWSGLSLFSLSRGRRWAHTLYGVLVHNARSRCRVAYILKELPKASSCYQLTASYLQGYGSVSAITDRATFEDTGSRLSNLKLSESVDSSALPSEELAAWGV
jgi:hypothetical protein